MTTRPSASAPPDAEAVKQRATHHWNSAAVTWDRWFGWYTDALRPLSDWCCDSTSMARGDRVLDIACGTGEPSTTAARRVGPDGFVLATDIASAMVDATKQRARHMGLTNMDCRVMDAEHLDVPDGSFDVVTFACGLMFCPEPAMAVSEIRRVLAPGGRFAIAAWDEPATCDFATVFGVAANEVLGVPPPTVGGPGPFRLAAPGALAAVLREGGLMDFEIAPRPMAFRYASPDEYLLIMTDLAVGLRPRLDALPVHERARFESLVRRAAERHVRDGAVRLSATPLCAAGLRA